MYYEIRGYKPVQDKYSDVAYNKAEKNALIKQYKKYLQNKEIDIFKVASYLDNGTLKEIVTYS